MVSKRCSISHQDSSTSSKSLYFTIFHVMNDLISWKDQKKFITYKDPYEKVKSKRINLRKGAASKDQNINILFFATNHPIYCTTANHASFFVSLNLMHLVTHSSE